MEILSFKKANCKNCYKCIRECPVKAISFKGEQAQILQEDCVLCGNCLLVCPQNAKEARNDTHQIVDFIRSGNKVVASVAPSFISEFGLSHISQLAVCLKKLGIHEVEETATGAFLVKEHYQRLASEGEYPNIITTACPTIVGLVQKYHAEAVGFLAPVVSPMIAHGMMLKQKYGPETKVVFIGPCLSKKDEITHDQNLKYIDCAITFDELQAWFEQEDIHIDDSVPIEEGSSRMAARFFPKAGGILASMDTGCANYEFISADGVERCRKVLEELIQSRAKGYFIEMSACEGSCINGPGTRSNKNGCLVSQSRVEAYAKKAVNSSAELPAYMEGLNLSARYRENISHRSMPSGKTIAEILSKIGKTKPEDELNCGACGYSTCREKAIAVYFEKAELEMCLPYMRDRAESISDKIINSTPNAIIAVDDHLMIQQMNMAAQSLFNIGEGMQTKGAYIGKFIDPVDFETVIATKENISNQRTYLSLFGKHVEQSILYIKQHHLILGIMKDVTDIEKQYERIKEVRISTLQTADKVIEKQMRVAQEIASLLGETTAETKIALTKLKNTIMLEE